MQLRIASQLKTTACFAIIFAIYIFLGSWGYGTDWDTYGLIKSGRQLITDGTYKPSRYPGYIIPEIIIGAASITGGHLLSNAISAMMGAISLLLFYSFLKKTIHTNSAIIITGIVASNPYFILAATSTMDYIYSIFFILIAISLQSNNKLYLAACFFSLAIGSRLSNSIFIAIIYLYFIYDAYRISGQKVPKQEILACIISAILSIGLYIPSFIHANYSLGFLTYYIADLNWIGHLSRWIYKNIYLLGPICSGIVLASLTSAIFNKRLRLSKQPIIIFSFIAVAAQEILFLKVPLEISYLLPIIFIGIPLWFHLASVSFKTQLLILALTFAYSFLFNIELLSIKYDKQGYVAIDANIHPRVLPGKVITDLQSRRLVQLQKL